MTAPTSPGVVPADVKAAGRVASFAVRDAPNAEVGASIIARAIMADRANRSSLTEDERGQIRREALEEAANAVEALKDFGPNVGDRQRFTLREIEAYIKGFLGLALSDIRALADRSEPRNKETAQ